MADSVADNGAEIDRETTRVEAQTFPMPKARILAALSGPQVPVLPRVTEGLVFMDTVPGHPSWTAPVKWPVDRYVRLRNDGTIYSVHLVWRPEGDQTLHRFLNRGFGRSFRDEASLRQHLSDCNVPNWRIDLYVQCWNDWGLYVGTQNHYARDLSWPSLP